MNYKTSMDIIDEANRLFGNNWCKYRRTVSWERLLREIDKARMGKKTRWPFRIKGKIK